MPAPTFDFQRVPDDVRERLTRNWAALPADVQERLSRAGFQPETPEPDPDPENRLGQATAAVGDFAKEHGGEIAGATALPLLAGPLGLPAAGVAGLLTGMGLAGAGGAGGRALSTGIREGRLPTAGEAGGAFARNAAGEGVARGAMAVGSKLLGRGSPEATQVLAEARRGNVPMSAGEFSPAAARVQAGIARTPTGAGTVQALDDTQNAALSSYLEREVVDLFGGKTGAGAAGASVQAEALPALRAVKHQAHGLYNLQTNAATRLKLEAPVPNDLIDAAGGALSRLDEFGLEPAQSGRVKAILGRLVRRGEPTTATSPLVDAAGKPITTTTPPTTLPFRELEAIARDLRDVIPPFSQRGTTTSFAKGSLEAVHGRVEGLLDDVAKGTPVEPLRQAAKEFYASEVVPLRQATSSVRGSNVTPDAVLDLMVRAQRPDRARVLLSRLSPETGDEVRAAWFTKKLEEATDANTGDFNPAKFAQRWNKVGPAMQGILAGGHPDEVGRAFQLVRTVAQRQYTTANPSRTAYGLGALGQAYAATEALRQWSQGDYKAAAAALGGVLAPPVLGRLIASRVLTRYFAIGLTAPAGSSAQRVAIDSLMETLGPTLTRLASQSAATSEAVDLEPLTALGHP